MKSQDDPEAAQKRIERVIDDFGNRLDAAAESPLEPDLPPDRTRQYRSVNLSRMRLSFKSDDAIVMSHIHYVSDEIILDRFLGAYDLLDRIYLKVREPLTKEGEILTDKTGRPRWKVNEGGFPIESWRALDDDAKDDFLWELSVHLFTWEQEADKMWGDAMFAKGLWEQSFAEGFTGQAGRLTIDDRTQSGHRFAEEDRYFGIFQAVLSRRAEHLVHRMQMIERRLARDYRS